MVVEILRNAAKLQKYIKCCNLTVINFQLHPLCPPSPILFYFFHTYPPSNTFSTQYHARHLCSLTVSEDPDCRRIVCFTHKKTLHLCLPFFKHQGCTHHTRISLQNDHCAHPGCQQWQCHKWRIFSTYVFLHPCTLSLCCSLP